MHARLGTPPESPNGENGQSMSPEVMNQLVQLKTKNNMLRKEVKILATKDSQDHANTDRNLAKSQK